MSYPQISFSLNIVTVHNVAEWKIVFQDLMSLSDGMEQEATQFK